MFHPENVQALVRRTHEERVLKALRQRGVLSRAQLAERVGISRTTVSEITADLIARGAVIVTDTDAATRTGSGRRAQLLRLDATSGQYLGVDLGHRRVRVVVAGAAREVLATGAREYGDIGWADRVAEAVRLVDETAERHGLHYGALQGVAVGVTGTDAALRARVTAAFGSRFDAPLVIDNNTRFAALAEALADGPDAHDLVYLRLADGVGGGIVTGGRLVAGGRGAAGELGHVRVVEGPDARLCGCGKHGCLETVAAVPAVLEIARSGGARVDTPEQLASAYADGDRAARAAVDAAADAAGRVLGSTALILSPARIVVGGTLVRLVPQLLARITEALATELDSVGGGLPEVRGARLDDEDGARGAVAALQERSPLLADYAMTGDTSDD